MGGPWRRMAFGRRAGSVVQRKRRRERVLTLVCVHLLFAVPSSVSGLCLPAALPALRFFLAFSTVSHLLRWRHEGLASFCLSSRGRLGLLLPRSVTTFMQLEKEFSPRVAGRPCVAAAARGTACTRFSQQPFLPLPFSQSPRSCAPSCLRW